MPNPDDLLENADQPAKPNLRQQTINAAPQQQADARAVAQRMAPKPAQPAPIVVNGDGAAAAPGSLRDNISISAAAQQADARAVSARISPPAAAGAAPAAPELAPAEPAASPYRERLAARAAAAPSAIEQAARQRMTGAAPAPAKPLLLEGPAPTGPSVAVDGAGNAAAPGAPRTTLPATVQPPAANAMVPQGQGARPPVRPGAPPTIDVTPKPPTVKPAPPPGPAGPMFTNANAETALDQSARSRVMLAEAAQRQSQQAAAARMAANPQPPNVASMRQQVGLHPTPPAPAAAAAPKGMPASPVAEAMKARQPASPVAKAMQAQQAAAEANKPGAISRAVRTMVGNTDDWAKWGQDAAKVAGKAAPALKVVGKVAGVAAPVIGAYETYDGIQKGDAHQAAWGAADTIAGTAALVPSPAQPVAWGYLVGRGLYEGGKWLYDKFHEHPKPAAAPAAKPAAAPAAAATAAKPAAAAAPATPAAKPAAQPAAQPAAAAPAAAPPPDQSAMLANARDEAHAAIDNEEGKDPTAVYYQTVNHNTGTTTYETRDRGQITVKTGEQAANPDDQKRIDEYNARQQRRDSIEQQYQQMLNQMQGGQQNTGPVADAARGTLSASANPKVTAFAQQYGEIARATGEKLGVDPNLLLAQWGHETGWGKSVIPGTNNLGNIKAVKGQAGVGATDNLDGTRDNYAQYGSPQEFANQYADLISRRYPGAVGAGSDMGKFAGALKAGGYAADPAYATKLQAAYASLGSGAPAPAQAPAGPARDVRDPLKGMVQIIEPDGTTHMAMPGFGGADITQAAYNSLRSTLGSHPELTNRVAVDNTNATLDGKPIDPFKLRANQDAYQAVARANPELASRLQVDNNGLLLDGTDYVPSNVLAAGGKTIAQYLRNHEQAQRFAVNPEGAKLADTALQGELANAGHTIQAGATRYNADQQLAGTKITAAEAKAAHRYETVGGGNDPATGQPRPQYKFDTEKEEWLTPPDANYRKPEPQAIAEMKANPALAPAFILHYGAAAYEAAMKKK